MRGLLGRLVSSRWVCNVVIVGFIFTQGFLNFTQSGSSYTSGLCFLALGLYILVGQSDTWWRPMAASICFGVAVCLWFLFIWAIPAAALFPFMWSGITKRTLARVSVTCISVSLFVGFSYLAVLAMSGMHDPSVVRAWITSATHGVNFGGPTRAIFGFARSFINMGNDGILFKRFLLRDPLNPVPLAKLISVSLWKLALFYSFAAAIVAMGLRASRGWGLIALLAVGCGPMLLFAIEFDGGAVERYLPLYPYVFIVLGLGLASTRGPKLSKMVALIFILLMTLNNTIALSKVGLSRQQSAIETRIAGIQGKLTPGSFVYTAIWTDELINFNRSFPFNPLNINGALHVGSLVTQGTEEVKTWREDFAAKTLKVWQSGGDIWLSNRAVAERPKFDWNWVEGDDRNISWRDFPAFFSRLDLSESIGGEDGFRLVEPTDHNRVMLALLALKHP